MLRIRLLTVDFQTFSVRHPKLWYDYIVAMKLYNGKGENHESTWNEGYASILPAGGHANYGSYGGASVYSHRLIRFLHCGPVSYTHLTLPTIA